MTDAAPTARPSERLPTPIPRFALLTGALTPADPVRLPSLPGSELRGLLTQGLTRIGRLRDGDPAPFTLTPQWLGDPLPADRIVDWPAGQPIRFQVLWFGADPDPAAVVSAGWAAVGWQPFLGRGRQRARFANRVETSRDACATRDAIEGRCAALAGAPALTLHTVTPLALRARGDMLRDFGDGTQLLTSIRHRAARLADDFTPAETAPLPLAAPLEVLADDTVTTRYRRYGRGGRFTPMQGLYGAARVAQPGPAALRALVVGEALRAGRWTAFGAGRYVIEAHG